jgi:hypothetical protein
MRPFIGMCFLLFIINHFQVAGQSQEYFCGWSETLTEEPEELAGPCFDVNEIFSNCTPVYIRINLHFFVNDDCNGKVQQMEKNQKDIYKIAEEMIYFANKTFEDNEIQRRGPDTPAPCVPVRLLLKGIHIHCKSDAMGIYNTKYLDDEFGVDKGTTFNFYIADTEDGSTGIGYHNLRCGSAIFFNKEKWWTIGNFVHELGHMLTLSHSFGLDGCTDTPIIKSNWDKNCNGILEDSSDPKLDETDITCWNKIDPGKLPGENGYSDMNTNNVHDCDELPPCENSPCCGWYYVDNNVMSYSAAKVALTECQIKKMLKDLSGFNCGIIESIGGCPPASAFITLTPEDIKDVSRCRECLILEASANENEYELTIYELVNNQEALVYNDGWKSGQAGIFCYRTGQAFIGLYTFLKPNTNYVARLKTRNECSDAEYKYQFTTNMSDCGNVNYDLVDVSPNPAFNEVITEFMLETPSESMEIYAKDLISGYIYPLLNNHLAGYGANQLSLDISSLPSGTYTLILIGENSLFQNNFVKI